MQVLNNASAFQVWKSYAQNVNSLRNSMSKLSSGLRIESAVDDPAGLAISERLRAQIRNSAQAAMNIENSISYMQTADSWLQAIHNILGRMSELAVAAIDGTKTTTDLGNLQAEFSQMQAEINRIVDGGGNPAGKYGGQHLFNGNTLSLQVGPDHSQVFVGSGIELRSNQAVTMAMSGTIAIMWSAVFGASVGNMGAAKRAMNLINRAIDHISTQRATVGAEQSRLTHTLEALRNYEDNIRASESRIRDVDVAKETTEFSKYQILVQVGTAMLAQANAMPQGVVQLLG